MHLKLKFNKMSTVKLQILKKDIEETSYFNQSDCAITRALHRAGYDDAKDEGLCISKNRSIWISGKVYSDLTEKVQYMYRRITEPEDFEIELEINHSYE